MNKPKYISVRYYQDRKAYRTCRKLFRNEHKKVLAYKEKNELTKDEFEELSDSIRLGMLTLEYLNDVIKKYHKYGSSNDRIALERQILRRRVDEIRDIIFDTNKKLVSDNGLEGKVD
jgi:hypothetical protein